MKERYDRLNPRKTLSPRHNAILSPALSRGTEDDYSSHSPYADWSKRIGKENADPDTTDGSFLGYNKLLFLASPVSTQRSGMKRNLRIIETGVGTKSSLKRPEQAVFVFSTPQNTGRKSCEADAENDENSERPVETFVSLYPIRYINTTVNHLK